MPKKKILFLSNYAGHPQFQSLFAEVAKDPNYEVKVILPREVEYSFGYQPQRFPKRKTIDNVEYIPGRLFFKNRYNLSGYIPVLPQTLLSYKPDVFVLVDEMFTIDMMHILLYRFIFRLQFTVAAWGQASYVTNPSSLRSILPWFYKLTYPAIRKIIARNNTEQAKMREVLPASKVAHTVYWGTPTDVFTPQDTPRAELLNQLELPPHLEHTRILGFIGRVVPEKGVLQLVQSLQQLPKDVSLIVIGQGKEEYVHEIQQFITEHNLNDRCIMLQDKHYTELPAFYNLLDMLVLPTNDHNGFFELFGRVLAEAMLSKTLVVGSDNGSIPEVINDAQCIFPQNDWAAMTHTIQQLLELSPEAKQTMLEQHYTHAQQNFSVQNSAQQLIGLLES